MDIDRARLGGSIWFLLWGKLRKVAFECVHLLFGLTRVFIASFPATIAFLKNRGKLEFSPDKAWIVFLTMCLMVQATTNLALLIVGTCSPNSKRYE